MIDLTPLIQAVIALLASIVTYKLIPWIKAKTTKAEYDIFSATVKTAVFAAEQIFGAGNGEQKFEYVCEMLRDRGFDFDRDEIEAAVRENYDKLHAVNTVDVKSATENSVDDGK